ncbi:MAG: hypothetical protein Q8O92_05455 [Candidatus Latescibacter sp.]|nr:hypothetical protein [Candidatus Latescibacter sp.]
MTDIRYQRHDFPTSRLVSLLIYIFLHFIDNQQVKKIITCRHKAFHTAFCSWHSYCIYINGVAGKQSEKEIRQPLRDFSVFMPPSDGKSITLKKNGGIMEGIRLSKAPISIKLLTSTILCIIGLIYLALLVHICIDTEMKVSLVAKSYGGMEYIELTDHAHIYLPYYSLFIFFIPISLFMFTSYGEKLKSFFAVVPFLFIVVDIGSMYLIPYVSPIFATVLYIAGTCLGLTFLTLFSLLQYELWFRKTVKA